MTWEKTRAEFDGFAADYARFIVGGKDRPPVEPGCRAAIDRFEPETILDCACGQGRSSIALRSEGRSVRGSDISPEMIRLARKNAREAGLHVPFAVAGWHELPGKVAGPFDFVMCQSNAIGHCRGERAMLRALRAIRKVTRKGGRFYLDSRSWEWFRAQPKSWWPGTSRDDSDGRHTIIFRAPVPKRWSDPHVTEVVHITESDVAMTIETRPVTFYAFKISELRARLRAAGFGNIETDYEKGSSHYWVVAEAI